MCECHLLFSPEVCMPCDAHAPGCPGPFNEDSCDACVARERDGCLHNPPKSLGANRFNAHAKTCGGPFAAPPAWRCVDCQQFKPAGDPGRAVWHDIQAQRALKRAWLKRLEVIEVRPVYLASECAEMTPGQIDYCYRSKQVDWCPFVRIGNLFATVTTGNDAGWRLLIQDHLQSDPKEPRDIHVFTGRHGNPEGTRTLDDREIFTDKVPDADHLLQDILQKAVADGQYQSKAYSSRPRIHLWDVGTTAGSDMTKTQHLAQELLARREIVVFAWCWSLLSFYKTTDAQAQAFSKWDLNQPYNKPIGQIVDEHYGWALRPAPPPAHGHGEWRASVAMAQRKGEEVAHGLLPPHLSAMNVRDSKDRLMEGLRKGLAHGHQR